MNDRWPVAGREKLSGITIAGFDRTLTERADTFADSKATFYKLSALIPAVF
ncbi:MAG TPA: hypothetical protein PKN64_14210 [Casimicrobium sp.]|nr:hypothetical protein [Casimicrobium sp.]